jgi:hypothetical protein
VPDLEVVPQAAIALTIGAPTTTIIQYQVEPLVSPSPSPTPTPGDAVSTPGVSVTESKTFAASAVDTYQACVNAAPITLTIPENASVAIEVWAEIQAAQLGAGTVAIAPAAGVTLNGGTAPLVIAERYRAVMIKKIAPDAWILHGAAV